MVLNCLLSSESYKFRLLLLLFNMYFTNISLQSVVYFAFFKPYLLRNWNFRFQWDLILFFFFCNLCGVLRNFLEITVFASTFKYMITSIYICVWYKVRGQWFIHSFIPLLAYGCWIAPAMTMLTSFATLDWHGLFVENWFFSIYKYNWSFTLILHPASMY